LPANHSPAAPGSSSDGISTPPNGMTANTSSTGVNATHGATM
jgi:hypothetical protein